MKSKLAMSQRKSAKHKQHGLVDIATKIDIDFDLLG